MLIILPIQQYFVVTFRKPLKIPEELSDHMPIKSRLLERNAMKGLYHKTVMRFLCTRHKYIVKARQLMHICQCGYHARGLSLMAVNKLYQSSYRLKDMSYIHKRSILHHTPSMGLIGHGFNSRKHVESHPLIETEDHTLSFAESFSSTTGKFQGSGLFTGSRTSPAPFKKSHSRMV